MHESLRDWLHAHGLAAPRADIYLAALARGEATANQLAQDTDLGRTGVYDHLRALETEGYLRSVRNGKRTLFLPLHPQELLRRAEHHRSQIKELLPDFLALFAGPAHRPFVQAFTGPHAAQEVFEDILRSTKTSYAYFSAPGETLRAVDRAFMKEWVKRRIAKGVSCRCLRAKTTDELLDHVFSGESPFLRQIRFLPGYIPLKSSIYIYGGRIAIVSSKKEGAAFIVHSHDFAESLGQLFELLWSLGTKS